MRRAFWVGIFVALVSCNTTDDDDDQLVPQITRVSVAPEDFLGNLSCGLEGGMQRYQATLVDVTEGRDEAFVLPSSSVVSCRSQIFFEFVQPGRRYIAQISGFAVTEIAAQYPGSPIVVDDAGQSVLPDWSTTCWGDAEQRAGGGAGGEGSELGATALDRTVVRVRGCDPLEVDGDSQISIDLKKAMFGLGCGSESGEVARFQVYARSLDGGGGLGGSGSEDLLVGEAPCGQEVVVGGLPAGIQVDFVVLAFEEGRETPTWDTTCTSFVRPGVTTPARCNPVLEL